MKEINTLKVVPRVEIMRSPSSGREVANQLKIFTNKGVFFQSYSSIIAFRPYGREDGEPTVYLSHKWDYSRTTGKYRNQFLNESKQATEAKIKSGQYQVVDWLR